MRLSTLTLLDVAPAVLAGAERDLLWAGTLDEAPAYFRDRCGSVVSR